MRQFNRRAFLGASAAGLFAIGAPLGCAGGENVPSVSETAAATSGAASFDRPISFQSFGMRKEIEKDFSGTLKAVKALGFDGIEMCSPHGNFYKVAGFGNLTAVSPSEIKRQIEDTGLFCKSSHFEAHEVLVDDLAKTIDYAAALGLEVIVMSGATFGDDGTVDDIKKWGEQCNKAGEAVKAAGLRLGYHNHLVGPVVGEKPQYEHIMDVLDPNLVTMQFQLASISGGYDPVFYLDKYAGRFFALHMADWDPAAKGNRPGRLGASVPIGEGMIDWAALLKAAMKSDVADYGFIIEMETKNPIEDLRKSIAYLKTVPV